jgi:4-hydroxy-3-polyprenylbenzoate decarboxylase
MAAAGNKIRVSRNDPQDLQQLQLPANFSNVKIVMPGVLALQWNDEGADHDDFSAAAENLRQAFAHWTFRENYPWVSIVDDTSTLGEDHPDSNLRDFLWLTFTRSDPARDIYGYNERVEQKHWTCDAPLFVDARIKPHHQKVIEIDEKVRQSARNKLKNVLEALP